MNWRVSKAGLVAVSLFLGAWIAIGCYTTLKHPVLRTSSEGTERARVHFGDDCWTCHSSQSEVFWLSQAPPATAGFYAWDFFYTSPWWVDDFYYGRGVGATGSEEGLPNPRDFRRRGAPALPPGAPALQQPGSQGVPAVARKAAQSSEDRPESAESEVKDARRSKGRRGQSQSKSGSESKKSERRKGKP